MNPPRILVVDDEKNITFVIQAILNRQGMDVVTTNDSSDVFRLLDEEVFDAVLTDLYMPGPGGMEILEFCKTHAPQVPVILMTAFGTIDTAVTALKKGAYDFITKPFEQNDLIQITQKAVQESRSQSVEPVRHSPSSSTASVPSTPETKTGFFAGSSPAIIELNRAIRKIAPTHTHVLLYGEIGSGKELLAREIHRLSPRALKPFIKLNCSALHPSLLQNELFGFEAGTLSGANYSKPGKLELAHEGTLLIDEITDIPLDIQKKMLRLISEKEFERVGGMTSISTDIRIIAGTQFDLDQKVAEGLFSSELLYTLQVAALRVPPLRERGADLDDLIYDTLREANQKLGAHVQTLHPSALQLLKNYSWPGNLRQLDTVIERAVLMTDSTEIQIRDLPEEILNSAEAHGYWSSTEGTDSELGSSESHRFKDIVRKKTQTLERELIAEALKTTSGNITHAAERLGLSRKGLQLKIKELGIPVQRVSS